MVDAPSAGVALVVGGAGGIGRATSMVLAGRGWTVAVADADADAATEVASGLREVDAEAMAVAIDVTSSTSVTRAVGTVVGETGRLDALVNVSGVTGPAPAAEVTESDWNALLDVHVGGSLRCSQAAFEALCASDHPAIVHVASVAARLGLPRRASYCAAKAAIEGLCRTLAVEWAPHRIRVNAIAPGYVRTDPVGRMIARGYVDEGALTARIPLRRLARPEEIATAIAFLVSPDASYITGETLFIDGGLMVSGEF